MERIDQKELLKAGVHFGHLRSKWNPKMLQYIFMEKKGIHLIDLNKTSDKLLEAAAAMKAITQSGRKIMFVATKKQAKETVKEIAKSINMPFVTERWLGGMLTNFGTIRKSIKKMQSIEKMLEDTSATGLTKKERLMLSRQKDKLNTVLGGIEQLNRLPAAIFVVDINHEHIAIKEAKKLGIRTFGMVDTNSNPSLVDFAIPANDDASKSIEIITQYLADAIKEGLSERQNMKDTDEEEEDVLEEVLEEDEDDADDASEEEEEEEA
jgi:small subunit ribosomal protein S2